MFASASRISQHENSFRIIGFLGTNVLNSIMIPIPQIVKAEAVCFFVYHITERSPKLDKLCLAEGTFKHGVLHPLPMGHAAFGHLAKPFSACRGGCIDIISNEYEHRITSIEMADSRPDRPASIWQEGVIVRREQGPMGFFHSERDG